MCGGQQGLLTGSSTETTRNTIKSREPSEWKSDIWWRNQPVETRLSWLHIPPRTQEDLLKHKRVQVLPWAKQYTPGRNLFVTGKRGKSVFAAQLLLDLVRNQPVSGRWIQADRYIEALKDSFDSSNGLLGDEYSTPYLVKNIDAVYDVVVLDGLGDERKTDFAVHELGNLIRARYDRMKTTIITSRLSIGDISSRYGDRLSTPMSDFDLEVMM